MALRRRRPCQRLVVAARRAGAAVRCQPRRPGRGLHRPAVELPHAVVPRPRGPGPAPLGALVRHVARVNPAWREPRTDVEALVVFQGPQAYVRPGWYPSKAETGKVVPTWNYVMVQARGRLRVIDDVHAARALVTRLTERHEATQARPWGVSDAPADYIDALLRAIV